MSAADPLETHTGVVPNFTIEAVSLLAHHRADGTYDVRLVGDVLGERVRLTARLAVGDVERFYGPAVARWLSDAASPREPRSGRG